MTRKELLARGLTWFALYAAEAAAGNLTRITVDGPSNNTAGSRSRWTAAGPEVMT